MFGPNRLTALPTEIGQLTGLGRLMLEGNGSPRCPPRSPSSPASGR
jgi:hypothetical protein